MYVLQLMLFKPVFKKLSTASLIANWIKWGCTVIAKFFKNKDTENQTDSVNKENHQKNQEGKIDKKQQTTKDLTKKRTIAQEMLKAQQSFNRMKTKRKSVLFDIGDDSDDENSANAHDDSSNDSAFFDQLSDDLSSELPVMRLLNPHITNIYKTVDDYY